MTHSTFKKHRSAAVDRSIKHKKYHVYLEYPTPDGIRVWKQQTANSNEEAAFRLGYMAAKFHNGTAHLDGIYLIYCNADGSVFQLDPITFFWREVHYDPHIERKGHYTYPQ
uniref:Uncharacterized protein n=1 Tax=viral metagenome TaxID=1070528 RepID=A0A6C0C050_9ZZZZ